MVFYIDAINFRIIKNSGYPNMKRIAPQPKADLLAKNTPRITNPYTEI
jgi:hypothetical protein